MSNDKAKIQQLIKDIETTNNAIISTHKAITVAEFEYKAEEDKIKQLENDCEEHVQRLVDGNEGMLEEGVDEEDFKNFIVKKMLNKP